MVEGKSSIEYIESMGRRGLFDPRTKLILLIIASLLVVYSQNIIFLCVLQVLILVIFVIGRFNFRDVTGILLPIIQFSIPILLLQAFLHENKGQPLLWLDLSQTTLVFVGINSLTFGLIIFLKISIIASASLTFSLSTKPEELLQALRSLKIPFEIAWMAGLVLFFLPLVRKELLDVRDALAIRGLSLTNGSIRRRIKTLRVILLSGFLNFFDIARHQAIAMESRAFRAKNESTYLYKLRFGIKDICITFGAVFFGIVAFWIIR